MTTTTMTMMMMMMIMIKRGLKKHVKGAELMWTSP